MRSFGKTYTIALFAFSFRKLVMLLAFCFLLNAFVHSVQAQSIMHGGLFIEKAQSTHEEEEIELDDYIFMDQDADEDVYFIELDDPYVKFNKFMLKFNKALDKVVIRPIAQQYQAIMPRYVTKRIFLVFQNLQEPLYFINKTLKLDIKSALTSLWRFTINSTFGIAGMYDVASKMELEHNEASFEEVLNKIGMQPGDYLMLPLLGPTNTRGALALVADIFLNPLTYILNGGDIYIYRGADIISIRDQYFDEINELLYEEDDTYLLMKNMYEQQLTRQQQ